MENEQKNKMTTGQIVKLCFVILAIIMILGSIAIAILLPHLPKNLSALPLVLFITALIIMLVLKTIGRPAITVPRPELDDANGEPVGENDPSGNDKPIGKETAESAEIEKPEKI